NLIVSGPPFSTSNHRIQLSKTLILTCSMLFYWQIGYAQHAEMLLLDFGNGEAPAESAYMRVLPEANAPSFQWLEVADSAYQRVGLEGIRALSWQTGVIGSTLVFQLDLAPGDYWVMAAFDAGFQDESTLSVEVDEAPVDLKWQPFTPPSEPRDVLMHHFRIMQTRITSSGVGTIVKMHNDDDLVRLLSLTCYRAGETDSPRQEWIWDQILSAGTMNQTGQSLDFVKGNLLEDRTLLVGKDSWSGWWWTQVDLLDRAEEIFRQRGWEWAKKRTGMSMIQRAQQAVMILDALLAIPGHPFTERAKWLRGKFLFHLDLEYHGEAEKSRAQEDFRFLLSHFPDHRILRMYVGEKLQSEPQDALSVSVSSLAPEWSKEQLRALSRLKALVHYWVSDRQASNGELGGKLGDDVEALRFWTPLIHLNDSLSELGWRRLADCVWHSPLMHDGFARDISDVEHAAEFISDTAPLLLLMSDDTAYHHRVLPILEKFRDLWTTVSPNGYRFFRSAWYSSTDLDLRPPRDRDVQYNARTLKALRYWLWRYRDDTAVIAPMYEWARSWTAMSLKTDKGKPAGILPVSVRSTDESINGDEPHWHKANMFWSYFDYRGDGLVLDHLLSMWVHTGDDHLLAPLKASLQLIADSYDPATTSQEGTAPWAAAQMVQNRSFWGVAGQWRLLTGDGQFDELLLAYGPPYVKYRIEQDASHLIQALSEFNKATAFNWEMLTSEVYYTDRVLAVHSRHGQPLDVEVLKSMLTGDVSHNSTSPYVDVSWEDTFGGFTALVDESSRKNLSVQIFNHEDQQKEVTMRLWYLNKGLYTMQVNGQPMAFEMQAPGHRMKVRCVPQSITQITIAAR
ncbi:MAG: hypothetical protein OEQ53_10685, partial [Saprospiraceae bacterium]|nr:hypothetical protein [Saprospiraceae bacterium]